VPAVKLVVELERHELARVLACCAFDTPNPSVHQVRAAVRQRLADFGKRGCERMFARARREAQLDDAHDPEYGRYAEDLNLRVLWALDRVDRAFQPPACRRRQVNPPPLLETLAAAE
jgi:hypothetical protein